MVCFRLLRMGGAYVDSIIRCSQEVSRWFEEHLGSEVVFWFDVAQLTSSNSTLLILSDTASLVGTIHSDAAWAALQHGISAAFALAP